MLRILYIEILGFALIASALTGCQTSKSRVVSPSEVVSPSAVASDVVHYTGDVPVWIFIPYPTVTSFTSIPEIYRGYPAQIAVPPRRTYTTNCIEVAVAGQVVSPGMIRLPVGSTVLQAINCAGGFTAFAFSKQLIIRKSSGKPMRLFLQSRRAADSRYTQVWYDTKSDGPNMNAKGYLQESVSDYILDTDDQIEVLLTAAQ